MSASPFASSEEEVNDELLRLRELEEAAYKRLRQQDSVVKALKKELSVMKKLKDPNGEGEFQLQVAAKRKLVEAEIKNRTLQLEQAKEDAKNAFIAAKRQAGVRNSFKEAKERVERVTFLRKQRRQDLGAWPVVRMRVKDVVNLGDQGYGAAKSRKDMLAKARHILAAEKGVQNALVREKTWLTGRKAELHTLLAEMPVLENPNKAEYGKKQVEIGPMPPLKELVQNVHREEGKLMAIRNSLKGTAKERQKWERSNEDDKEGQIRALSIRISILEEQLSDQQAVVDQNDATLKMARKRIEQGGDESEQERYARVQYERAAAEKELHNVSTKLNEASTAIDDRFQSIGELQREQAEAAHYQAVAGARVAELSAELSKSNKWQVIAVEVRRALVTERDALRWQVENDQMLPPDVRSAMREKVDAMADQIVTEDATAVKLTKRREEMEAEIELLEGRIAKSKDDVRY